MASNTRDSTIEEPVDEGPDASIPRSTTLLEINGKHFELGVSAEQDAELMKL